MLSALTQFMSLEMDPNTEKKVENTTGRVLRGIASFAGKGSSLFRTVFSVLLIKDFYNTAKAALGGLLNLISPSRIVGDVDEWAKQTAAIQKTATVTRLTTDEVQEYRFVADTAGLSTTRLTDNIGALNAKFDKTTGRSKTFTAALRKLGLSADDLEKQGASTRFDSILDALGKIQDRTRRDDLGRMIFGSNFAEMNALLDNSTKNVGKLRAMARSSGAIISKEELQRVDRFNFLVKILSGTWNRFKAIAKGNAIKVLTGFIEDLVEYIDKNRDVLEDFIVFWFDLSIILRGWVAIMRLGMAILQKVINLIRVFKNDSGLLKLVIISVASATLYWAAANNGQLIPSLVRMVGALLPKLIPLLKAAGLQMLKMAKRAALLALKFASIAAAGIIAFIIIEQMVRFLQGKDNLLSDLFGFDKAQSDLGRFAKYFLGLVGALFAALLFLFGLPVALAGVIAFAFATVVKEVTGNWDLIKNFGAEVWQDLTDDAHTFWNHVAGFFTDGRDFVFGIFDAIEAKILKTFGKVQKFGGNIMDFANKGANFLGVDLPETPKELAFAFGPGATTPGIDRAARTANRSGGRTDIDASTKVGDININEANNPEETAKAVKKAIKKEKSDLARRIDDEYEGSLT